MFTKKSKSFCKTITTETEFSDSHKMTVAFLRAFVKRITSKNVAYRDHKHFNQNEFLHKIDLEMVSPIAVINVVMIFLIFSKELLINILQ